MCSNGVYEVKINSMLVKIDRMRVSGIDNNTCLLIHADV